MIWPWLWLTGSIVISLEAHAGWRQRQGHMSGFPALTLWLEVPAEVPAGRTVSLTLTVKNTANHAINIALGGRPAHDFVVERQAGTAVWHWTHGQVILSILERRMLQPGDALTFAGQWQQVDHAGQTVPAGSYMVRGVVRTEAGQQLQTALTPLTIVP